ncbi:TPA: hypothetical protein LUK36_004059 [Escherichia coli]|nr:hypothetical protein [Escherichia coli]
MKTTTQSGQAWRGYERALTCLLTINVGIFSNENVAKKGDSTVAKYNPGQKVKHVTGQGPVMVVDHYQSTTMTICTWFIGSKNQRGVFHEDTLVPFVPKTQSDDE